MESQGHGVVVDGERVKRVRGGRGLSALSSAEWWRLVRHVENQPGEGPVMTLYDEPCLPVFPWAILCRNRAAMWLMGHAGLRIAEVCAVMWSHLVNDGMPMGRLHVTAAVAKGARERQVPLDGLTQGAIDRAWRACQQLPREHAGVWFWGRGQNWERAGIRRLRYIVAEWARGAQLRVVRPHELRHTFASRLATRTTLPVIQQLMGHASLSSTQRYLAVPWATKVQAINALSLEG